MQNLQDTTATTGIDLSSPPTTASSSTPTPSRKEFSNIEKATALFVKTSFTSCDESLVKNLSPSSAIVQNQKKKFRGDAILKPTLKLSSSSLSDSSKKSSSPLLTSPSIVFPEQLRFVKFYSAAATLPKTDNDQDQDQYDKLESKSMGGLSAVIVRHERLFKHPVSTGCLIQSGCDVRINNKKVTSSVTTTKKSSRNASSNDSSTSTTGWSLYWGGRWREESILKNEIQTAIPISKGSSFRINHFPQTQQLGRKDYLAIALQKMKIKFPNDYNHHVFPQTFILPRDNAIFMAELKKSTSKVAASDTNDAGENGGAERRNFFIAKPPASSQGRGVFLFEASSTQQLPEEVVRAMNSSANNNNNNNSSTNHTNNSNNINVRKPVAPFATLKNRNKKRRESLVKNKNVKDENDDDESSSEEKDDDDDENDDEEEKDESILIQRYIPNPLLINGYKVDLRVYACCTSFEPLKVFVFNDGLVRFASVPFSDPTTSSSSSTKNGENTNQQQQFAHLTNVSINVKNQSKHYQQTDSAEQDGTEEGSKWTIQALKRFVCSGEWARQQQQKQRQTTKNTDNINNSNNDDEQIWNNCWKSVCTTITKVLISVQDEISSKVSSLVGNRNSCFELYGFDILLDDSLQHAHVLEVNILPSLVCNSALDRHIKGHMIADMLDLVGIGLVRRSQNDDDNTNQQQETTADKNNKKTSTNNNSKLIEHTLQGPILSSAAIAKMSNSMKKPSSSFNPNKSQTSPEEELQKKLTNMITAASVSSDIKKKSAAATSSSNTTMMIKSFMNTVTTDVDKGIIIYAEEELSRRGGWERVFPTVESIRELKHLFSAQPTQQQQQQQQQQQKETLKRGNKLLWAWEIAKSRALNERNQSEKDQENDQENETKNREQLQKEILEWMRTSSSSLVQPTTPPIVEEKKKIAPPPPAAPPSLQKRSSSISKPQQKKTSVLVPRVASVKKTTVPPVTIETAQLPTQVFSFQSIPHCS